MLGELKEMRTTVIIKEASSKFTVVDFSSEIKIS